MALGTVATVHSTKTDAQQHLRKDIMAALKDVLERRRADQDAWYVMRVVRYEIRYLATDCATWVDDVTEAFGTLDREQAYALARQNHGLTLIYHNMLYETKKYSR
jgi:hypothetical protein